VPIVSEEWATACAAAGRVLDSAAFLLPPFAGLHICCTGVEPGALRGAAHAACDAHPDACAYADVRLAIRDNTQANGGVYHSEMTKSRCTHLIASSADSDKYRHAVMWGTIKVVSAEWFEQSLEAKGEFVRLSAQVLLCVTPQRTVTARSVLERGALPGSRGRRGSQRAPGRCGTCDASHARAAVTHSASRAGDQRPTAARCEQRCARAQPRL
jgi:hypothetical protein